MRAAALLVAVGALAACKSSSGDASDSGVSQLDGSLIHDAAHGDGDGDDNAPQGSGDGGDDRDTALDEAIAALDASDEMKGGGDVADARDAGDIADAGDAMLPALEDLPYASEVVSFTPGASAGFGQTSYPSIVYGPPKGRGTGSGSLDVLSLGVGGEIVLGFGALDIVDGEGADFIVFENAFVSSAGMQFIELGEVAVSEDGSTWHAFACDEASSAEDDHPGCAGWTPTLRYDPQLVLPLDPELTGGDAFDLASIGVSHARYVRIRDLETQPGSANTGGFDLDAVGLVSYETHP